MYRRIVLITLCLTLLAAVPVFAQQQEELDCPAFADAAEDVRIGYYMGQGAGYMTAGQYGAAIYSYSCIAEQIAPDYIHAWLNRAVAHSARRSYDLAIEDYTTALSLDSGFAPAYNNRAIAHMGRMEYDEATDDLDQAISLNTNFALAYINRAILHAVNADYEAALTDLDEAISIADLENILDLMTRQDDPDTEIDESDVEIPVYDRQLAQAYAIKGMIEAHRALDSYQDYLILRGGNRDYRIEGAAGALESRFNFELRFDDGTWMLAANIVEDGN